MSSFLQYVRTAWIDHFPGTSPTNTYYSQTPTLRQILSGTGVYVSNCLFNSIVESNQGGALYCTSATYFLVESSSFFSCKTSSSGGAIYFSNSSGQSVLYKVCGYDCCTTNGNGYQFGYIHVNNTATSKNYVNYSSIVRCVNENSASIIFYFNKGNICCQSVNASMNKCGYRTLYNDPFRDSSSVTCSYSYSSFADNIISGYTCIRFWLYEAKSEIKSCNVLRNTQVSSTEGIIAINGNTMIADSCILENQATYIFHQNDASYRITLSNCTVDSTSNNGYLIIQNTVTKSFILALNHMSTRNCHSEYDSAGTLTPIIQSPSPSKKLKLCYTPRNCFCQCRLRYLISLISVYLFNFIYLDASNDPLY
jgi:hypothetical protein